MVSAQLLIHAKVSHGEMYNAAHQTLEHLMTFEIFGEGL